MKLFRRKPKKFNYAAIRIGNVYVLPPNEDDIREFNKKRRKEVTRRGFIVAGLAAVLGIAALPFLPGKTSDLDPKMLFNLDPAKADKELIAQLCIAFYQYPDPEIRFQCARVMAALPRNNKIKDCLWYLIKKDPIPRNRDKAIDSLIQHFDPNDIPKIVIHYHSDPASRVAIDTAIEIVEYQQLRSAIEAWTAR